MHLGRHCSDRRVSGPYSAEELFSFGILETHRVYRFIVSEIVQMHIGMAVDPKFGTINHGEPLFPFCGREWDGCMGMLCGRELDARNGSTYPCRRKKACSYRRKS